MRIRISLPAQTLELRGIDGVVLRRYTVSTAKNGAGEQKGSYRTPRGRHLIRAKIGAGMPENTVFVRRRPTGEVWSPAFGAAHPGRDWILTRILWLSGREPGHNRLGEVDTMCRYIYLHGSPDSVEMGQPGSIGCVRMRNRDIVELFDLVPPFTPVDIIEFAVDRDCEKTDLGIAVRARSPAGDRIGEGLLLPDGRIEDLSVEPGWQGKGVGSALVDALADAARERGMSRLFLQAGAATVFFEHRGFLRESGEVRQAGIPGILMARRL